MFRKKTKRSRIKVEPVKVEKLDMPEEKPELSRSKSTMFGDHPCPNVNVQQTVNVIVNEDQEDTLDKLASCCIGCFGKIGKSAAGAG